MSKNKMINAIYLDTGIVKEDYNKQGDLEEILIVPAYPFRTLSRNILNISSEKVKLDFLLSISSKVLKKSKYYKYKKYENNSFIVFNDKGYGFCVNSEISLKHINTIKNKDERELLILSLIGRLENLIQQTINEDKEDNDEK